jgi:hypothetical protein
MPSGSVRDVPLWVRLRLLFGGVLQQIGWVFLLFPLGFGWATVVAAESVPEEAAVILMPLAFVAVGAGLVGHSIRRNHRALRILERGRITHGVKVAQEPTGVKINERTVYAMTFRFEAGGRDHTCVSRTHETQLLSDEREPLVYDPDNPDDAVTLNDLPGGLELDAGGHLYLRDSLWWKVLVLPVLNGLVLLAGIAGLLR